MRKQTIREIILGAFNSFPKEEEQRKEVEDVVKEIRDYCGANGNIPVCAIGGISPENIELVKAAGARGGCMMSYMMRYS